MPLKGARDGGPGLSTHACKTRWLVHEQGYEAEAANVSSLFHFEWPPHPEGVHIINHSSREWKKNRNKGRRDFVSPRWAYTRHTVPWLLAFCLAATLDRQIGHAVTPFYCMCVQVLPHTNVAGQSLFLFLFGGVKSLELVEQALTRLAPSFRKDPVVAVFSSLQQPSASFSLAVCSAAVKCNPCN